ncbi:hypothetical protein [Bradyrhizobium genosp. SA-3]|uniref:hypothetical protein n=1 Tax=Bradyrhizobium genosp. SA-3 TaxID=508868 RepID=UPI0013EE7011|nr:hypothetical protein [Bradyrhizobium genosp. SA-3]
MTDKEFDATAKRLQRSVDDLLKLSRYQLWADDAESIAEMLQQLVERMKAR